VKEYLSVKEIQKLTGYNYRRICRAITSGTQFGKLKADYIGKMYFVCPDDFVKYLWVEGSNAGETRQAVRFDLKGKKIVDKDTIPVLGRQA
jgi:hypothetical protein